MSVRDRLVEIILRSDLSAVEVPDSLFPFTLPIAERGQWWKSLSESDRTRIKVAALVQGFNEDTSNALDLSVSDAKTVKDAVLFNNFDKFISLVFGMAGIFWVLGKTIEGAIDLYTPVNLSLGMWGAGFGILLAIYLSFAKRRQ